MYDSDSIGRTSGEVVFHMLQESKLFIQFEDDWIKKLVWQESDSPL